MSEMWEWATGFEWWQYLLTIYVIGYVITVFTNMDTFKDALPKARETREWQEAEELHPRMAAGLLAFIALFAALFWPFDAFRANWWRSLVGARRKQRASHD
ncbi:hypothetical protein IU451_28845 [Nocardia cyriacigeorgica]|uniref:hypothetical protein n=1 Tax=Nocardia cyriacigeorgica TaxID=135487 RepID=UPI0018960133|nr:hypothetical protein [Nocardia cyriacigeorgica]MBF6326511.1 hypothetical protein [Nocardia cyriacigeorgica]